VWRAEWAALQKNYGTIYWDGSNEYFLIVEKECGSEFCSYVRPLIRAE
jgi:hypothetical protein